MKILHILIFTFLILSSANSQSKTTNSEEFNGFRFGFLGAFYDSKIVFEDPMRVNSGGILGFRHGFFLDYKIYKNIFVYSSIRMENKGLSNDTSGDNIYLQYIVPNIGLGVEEKQFTGRLGLYYGWLNRKESYDEGVSTTTINSTLKNLKNHDLGLNIEAGVKFNKRLMISLGLQLSLISIGRPPSTIDFDSIILNGDWMKNYGIGMVAKYVLLPCH